MQLHFEQVDYFINYIFNKNLFNINYQLCNELNKVALFVEICIQYVVLININGQRVIFKNKRDKMKMIAVNSPRTELAK